MNLKNLSTDELKALQTKVAAELFERELSRKQELWDAVVKAIQAYIAEYGKITIYGWPNDDGCDHRNITDKVDLQDPGDIDLR